MSDYDADVLTWSKRQADLLRRVGAGEAVNALIDWSNVAEEIESVGRSELHAVESLLVPCHLARPESRRVAAGAVCPALERGGKRVSR